MAGPLQFEAPTALDYFASLVADDASFALLEAAIAVAQDEYPDLDVQGVLAQIDELAERLRRRLPADAAPLQRLRLLNHYFFHELGFAGNVNDYYDRGNSYLAGGAADAARHPADAGAAVRRAGDADRAEGAWRVLSGPFPGQAAHAPRRGRDRSLQRPVAVARGTRRAAAAVSPPAPADRRRRRAARPVPAGGAGARRDRAPAAQPEGDPPQRARLAALGWRCSSGW